MLRRSERVPAVPYHHDHLAFVLELLHVRRHVRLSMHYLQLLLVYMLPRLFHIRFSELHILWPRRLHLAREPMPAQHRRMPLRRRLSPWNMPTLMDDEILYIWFLCGYVAGLASAAWIWFLTRRRHGRR